MPANHILYRELKLPRPSAVGCHQVCGEILGTGAVTIMVRHPAVSSGKAGQAVCAADIAVLWGEMSNGARMEPALRRHYRANRMSFIFWFF